MKKARKKRIVRRKRRVSERRAMQIKRGLMKRAKKLRLGAKRTGAYVYGTLRRITGNPLSYHVGGLSSLGAKRESQRRMRTYNQIKKSIQRGNASYGELAVLQSLAKEHPKLFAGDPMMAEAGGMSEAQFRRLRGNPYPTGGMTPLERLRYHVSGAIARGEGKPITDLSGLVPRKPRMVRVLGYDVVEGSKKHMRLLAQKRHFDDLQRSERGLRGNGADHKRHRWQLFGYDVWGNAEDGWEVNNILPGPVITLSYKAEYDQKTFDHAMRRRGSNLRYSMIDGGRSDEDTLYFDTPSGKPIAEMRRLK